MKNKLTKIISAFLIVTLLASMCSVFAFADEADSGAGSNELVHMLNRNFEEGWDVDNGLKITANNNKVFVDSEEASDYSYNYFARFEAVNVSEAYAEINFKTAGQIQSENGSVIKISFKADDFFNVAGATDAVGRIFYGRTGLGMDINFLAIKDGKIVTYADKAGTSYIELFELTNKWVDVAFVFDWDKNDFNYTVYYGDDYSESATVSFPYTNPLDKGLQYIRLGLPASTDPSRIGTSFCIDNFQVYQNTKEIMTNAEVDALGYGQLVDPTRQKTVEIQSGTGKSTDRILEESLSMKVGVDFALFKNEKRPIYTKDGVAYGAPVKIDGEVMIPLELLLEYIGFPVYVHADGVSYDITTGTSKTNLVAGRASASVNGERIELSVAPGYLTGNGGNKYLAIATADVELLFPGWLVTYDDMGLVIVYEDVTPENTEDNTEIVNRKDNLDVMVDLMKKFIFDTVTKDADGNTLRDNEKYSKTGEKVFADVKANTDGFKHPYLGANQSGFDKLNAIYAGKENNLEAKAYLDSLVKKAEELYNATANLNDDGTYKEIKAEKVPMNPYADGKNPTDNAPDVIQDTKDGYDPVMGHLTVIVDYTKSLLDLAFAYQVTRDDKYVALAYDYAKALGEWEHWGPGHMVDCAEASMYYALAYDWLYNRINELYGEEAVKSLAVIIFEKGVHQGYNASAGKPCAYLSDKIGTVPSYALSKTNENAVASSGMIVAALAIMEYENVSDIASINDMTADEERNYLVGNNIINLANNGLDAYAPDGSYIESATYWAYGTNALFKLIMSLESAAGTNYGFMDTWGIATTCYYACHIESSDGNIWNYHEGGADGVTTGELANQDTHMFNFVSFITGDSALAAIRKFHLTRSVGTKEISIFDMLYFPFDGIEAKTPPTLDYTMAGLDGFVARDSWEAGAMYTGLMSGANDAGFGQLDAGNFIYHNKGIVWFMDLGSENYNAYGYFGNARNNYYRCNTEGQNVLCLITSTKLLSGAENTKHIKFGQYSKSAGYLEKSFTNEHGSYAIVNNTDVYYGNAISAKRGILVTNDRKTVVIQDEVNFGVSVQDVTWIAHSAQNISISEDGKTAYLNSTDENGNSYVLRATMITTSKDFKFSVISAETPILETTYGPTDSVALGGAAEYSRAGIKRLAIECKQAVRFNVAIVLEMVENSSSTAPVGYEWVDLSNWVPEAEKISDSDVVVDTGKRGEAKESDIRTVTARAMKMFEDNTAFTEKLNEFYAALTTVEYTLSSFEVFDPGLEEDYYDYLDLLDQYDLFIETVNYTVEGAFYFTNAFLGIVDEEAEEEEEEESEDEESEDEGEEGGEEGGEEEE